MCTTFVTLFHHDLSRKIRYPLPDLIWPKDAAFHNQEVLREYSLIEPPKTQQNSQKTLQSLRTLGGNTLDQSSLSGREYDQLLTCVAAQLVVGIYTQALDIYLRQASEAEIELEWWGDIERSRPRAAYYLLQSTFPESAHRFQIIIECSIRLFVVQHSPLALQICFVPRFKSFGPVPYHRVCFCSRLRH